MRNQSVVPVVGMFYLIVVLMACAGWVMNIMAVAHSDFSHMTGWLIVRIIGIFIPVIGAFAGWF